MNGVYTPMTQRVGGYWYLDHSSPFWFKRRTLVFTFIFRCDVFRRDRRPAERSADRSGAKAKGPLGGCGNAWADARRPQPLQSIDRCSNHDAGPEDGLDACHAVMRRFGQGLDSHQAGEERRNTAFGRRRRARIRQGIARSARGGQHCKASVRGGHSFAALGDLAR